MLYVILAVVGLCLGSFVNALVWRIKNDRNFVSERSQCPHCGHTLAAKDLVPVASFLSLKGRCRYCNQPIEDKPTVEIALASIFVLSYIFWPANLHPAGNLVLFITWLASAVGLLALAVYDIRWMVLPNKILYPTFLVAAAGTLVYWLAFAGDKSSFLTNWVLSIVVAGGVFLILFLISSGRWIGYGDVRLGLITGTLLHKPALAFLMIFLSSILGSLAALPGLITGRREMSSKLPYGPFLILATFICLLFGQSLLDWYQRTFVG